jgi:hypothetical protein
MKTLLALIAILFFVACENPTETTKAHSAITIEHPTACIELPLVTASDTLIKHIESYTLKPSINKRARCSQDENGDLVYTCKGKNPDTLYTVSNLCPASAKLLQSLGGN